MSCTDFAFYSFVSFHRCLLYLKENLQSSNLNLPATNEYIYLPTEINRSLLDEMVKMNLDDVTLEGDLVIESSQHLSDLEALKLSQSNDFSRSIKLALSPDVKLNSFRIPLNTSKMFLRINNQNRHFELDELMTHLLRCVHAINSKEQSECGKYLTEQALLLLENDVHLNDIFFSTEYSHYDKRPMDKYHIERYKEIYLQAILENLFSSKEHVMCLVENGLLVLLHKLRELYPEKQVQNWISSCLSAMSCHEETHLHLYHTGWIGILAKWLNSKDLYLSLEAAKTLHNLAFKESLSRSLYILHPMHYSHSSSLQCDIVLVHGLQGGIFKTWRQSDSMKQTPDYTDCWPKSWLASDFDRCRILAVDYQTFLSNWNVNCGQVYSLKEISLQLYKELEKANVGKRPIIWITHSMGGLLVKEMLSQVEQSNESKALLDQTRGIVFYSVPHKGSQMAVWSPQMQRIISPSNHVLELRKGNRHILLL